MSRETDFKTRMTADVTLMATLLGGVYSYAELGRDGLTRAAFPGAFDANGFLRPCAVIKQRGLVPDPQIADTIAKMLGAAQVVEIYIYEDTGYTSIDAALDRLFVLFFGYQFTDSFELELVNTLDRQVDDGQLNGASMARQDWLINNVKGA